MGDFIQNIQEIDNLNIAKTIACDCTEFTKLYKANKNDFTVIAQNIRSIYHNFDDFLVNLTSFSFETDVIVLTECRLSAHKPIPSLDKYCSFVTTCQLNQNDGVVVYIKNSLKSNVKEIKLVQASCLQVEVLNNIIICIYRSPSFKKAENFIDSLDAYISTLRSENKNIIITGDININIIPKPTENSYEYKNRADYLNMLTAYSIFSGHSLPTRGQNCLDHYMLRIKRSKITAFIAILHTSITDHFTTFLSLSKVKDNQNTLKTNTTTDFEKALTYLREKKLTDLLLCSDPNILTDCLTQRIIDSIKNNTTTIKIPSNKRRIKPWITTGILRCIRNRNKLQIESRNDPFNETKKITYTRYRNHCNNLLKKIKRKYEREILAKSTKNNKLLWKNIKAITYTTKSKKLNTELTYLKPSPVESANFVNNFFANVGKELAEDIQSSMSVDDQNYYINELPTQPQSFALYDTDFDEINNIIINLKSDSAPGWDNISTRFIKFIRHDVTPVITYLANLCFRTGTFPSLLKQSIITPVFKGGDRDDVNNYRPISVLPIISKIIEKLLNNRLLNYLSSFNIISPAQFGFRQGISTEDAVTSLSTLVVEQLDVGKKCLSVFIDLKKAFDTVSLPILAKKLEKIGIRGTQLSIFKDYLSDRKQKVKLEQYISDDIGITCGVPQGSVLGPTLFIIYINDLCNMKIKNAKIFTYADDTAIVFSGSSWDSIKTDAEYGMSRVAKWLKYNLLTLNTSKTNYICFTINDSTQPRQDFRLKIHVCNENDSTARNQCDCSIIEKVSTFKYLGVILDQRLSWYPQVEQITSRIRKFIWMFKSLRHVVPKTASNTPNSEKNLLNEIYIALVQSVILYCIPIWGGALKTRFLDVERAQRALIKVMYFKKQRFPTVSLYQVSNLLSVRKLYIVYTILKKHKTLAYDPCIETKRRKNIVTNVPITKTTFASIQFKKRSAYLYNKTNEILQFFSKTSHECKSVLIKWIKTLSYEETETLLLYVK